MSFLFNYKIICYNTFVKKEDIMIYLDYAASTPVKKEVLDTFYDASIKYFANPNSSHKLGREAKNIIDECTRNIASNLKVNKEEIIYTSGASESNNLVVKGICERYRNKGKHILLSALEHNSIIASATTMQEQGFEVELIPVNHDGLIDIETLKQMLRPDTILVSVCSVDSEIGLKQPIEEIGKLLKDYPNCVFHSDASQSIGKVDIDYSNVDLVTITPHKFYGLPGISILIKKQNISLKPQINGGKSTTIYRSGTPELASIVACDKALSLALKNEKENYEYVSKLNKTIKDKLKKYKNITINSKESSIPFTITFSINGIKSINIQNYLENEEIYVSTKTSCCPIETPSKLVYALTNDKGLSTSSIRVSLSELTTEEEINIFLKEIDNLYKEYESNGKI